MINASNIIPVVESIVSLMTPVITIDSNVVSGANWELTTCRTYWITKGMTITISGADFRVVSFVLNTSFIVSGTAQPVGASFQLTAPEFNHGYRRKVNEERNQQVDVRAPFVYLPVPSAREDNTYDSDIAYFASIRPVFLMGYDQRLDTIDLQQDNVIAPLNEMADYFIEIVEDNDGLYNNPEDISRKEWMNFGNETVWGNDQMIFDQPLSGIEMDFTLEVLYDGVCDCDVEPENCPDVTTSFQAAATGVDTAAGQNIDFQVVDAADGVTPLGTLTENTANVKKVEVNVGGDPAENQVNGAAKTDIPAGGSKDFQIEYANGDPVVVTEVSDSATVFSGTIPNDSGSKDVYYNRAWLKSGTSYSTYDEAWRAANGANAYNEAIPSLSPIQQLDFTGGLRDKVLYLNFYGHKFRFVGILGGYYNPADGIYYDVNGVASTKLIEFPLFNVTSYWIIDTLTGHKMPAAGFSILSYSANLIAANAATWGGDTDFFVFSRDELYQLADASYNNCTHPSFRPPFNNANGWTCSPWQLAPSTNAFAFTGSQGGTTLQQAYGYAGYAEYYGRIELTGFVTQP